MLQRHIAAPIQRRQQQQPGAQAILGFHHPDMPIDRLELFTIAMKRREHLCSRPGSLLDQPAVNRQQLPAIKQILRPEGRLVRICIVPTGCRLLLAPGAPQPCKRMIILKQLRLRLLGSRFFFLRLCRLRKLSGDAFPERVQQALISRCLRLGGGRRLCLREREKQAFRLFRRFRSVKLLLIRHAKTSHRCDCFYYTPNPMRCPIGTQILHTNFSSVSGAFLKIKSCISRGACS